MWRNELLLDDFTIWELYNWVPEQVVQIPCEAHCDYFVPSHFSRCVPSSSHPHTLIFYIYRRPHWLPFQLIILPETSRFHHTLYPCLMWSPPIPANSKVFLRLSLKFIPQRNLHWCKLDQAPTHQPVPFFHGTSHTGKVFCVNLLYPCLPNLGNAGRAITVSFIL